MTSLLPYQVLVVDDEQREASWGETAKIQLEQFEFVVDHVYTPTNAIAQIKLKPYDIFIIDLFLQSSESGIDLQKRIRELGLRQPIILVTGQRDYLSQPLSNFADSLAQGPIQFYDKSSRIDLLEVVREVANRVDPIRRSFKLMMEAGLGSKEFNVSGKRYTVAQLLETSLTSDHLIRMMRESLYQLVLESQAVTQSGSESN